MGILKINFTTSCQLSKSVPTSWMREEGLAIKDQLATTNSPRLEKHLEGKRR